MPMEDQSILVVQIPSCSPISVVLVMSPSWETALLACHQVIVTLVLLLASSAHQRGHVKQLDTLLAVPLKYVLLLVDVIVTIIATALLTAALTLPLPAPLKVSFAYVILLR